MDIFDQHWAVAAPTPQRITLLVIYNVYNLRYTKCLQAPFLWHHVLYFFNNFWCSTRLEVSTREWNFNLYTIRFEPTNPFINNVKRRCNPWSTIHVEKNSYTLLINDLQNETNKKSNLKLWQMTVWRSTLPAYHKIYMTVFH